MAPAQTALTGLLQLRDHGCLGGLSEGCIQGFASRPTVSRLYGEPVGSHPPHPLKEGCMSEPETSDRAVTVIVYTRYEYRKVHARVHLLGETHLAAGSRVELVLFSQRSGRTGSGGSSGGSGGRRSASTPARFPPAAVTSGPPSSAARASASPRGRCWTSGRGRSPGWARGHRHQPEGAGALDAAGGISLPEGPDRRAAGGGPAPSRRPPSLRRSPPPAAGSSPRR